MDLWALKEEITYDEGSINAVYLDHLGNRTFGIGHLIRPHDPESRWPEGTKVSQDRVDAAFADDLLHVLVDCNFLYREFPSYPEEVKRIIANMMFNMGRTRLQKFKRMKRCVEEQDWSGAANEMVDSKWYRQVTKRADRLVKRMRTVKEENHDSCKFSG